MDVQAAVASTPSLRMGIRCDRRGGSGTALVTERRR